VAAWAIDSAVGLPGAEKLELHRRTMPALPPSGLETAEVNNNNDNLASSTG
jgi:hypothetical protein